jgi:23S rRNA (guanosine2251-2'-O)-methyltransferase
MNIEGKNAVGEALRAGTTIDVLLVEKGTNHPLVAQARAAGIKIQFVDRSVLERESLSKRHQGFIARATEFDYCEVEDILAESKRCGEDAFVVILDGIEDPHNLGSILRVCECAGVHGVIIPKNRAASVNDTAVRTESVRKGGARGKPLQRDSDAQKSGTVGFLRRYGRARNNGVQS